jgi:hypothetical protein
VGVQFVAIVAAFLCAMVVVPYCYNHRMDDGVFTASLLAFTGVPLIAGILQRHTHRFVALVVAVLLLFCPLIYAVTKPLAIEFETIRDSYFLGVGSTLLFVSATWLSSSYKTRRWIHAVAAACGLTFTAVAVFVLLWMVMYFE